MQAVELGEVRVHVLGVHPGLPGEADRARRELHTLDPAVVLADLDTQEALRALEGAGRRGRFEPGFVDRLYADEVKRRFAPDASEEEHPLLAVARWARDHRAGLVALRPARSGPGFFARIRAQARAGRAAGATPELFARRFAEALHPAWDAHADAERGLPRLWHALDEGRAPVTLVAQAHRLHAWHAALAALPRRSVA